MIELLKQFMSLNFLFFFFKSCESDIIKNGSQLALNFAVVFLLNLIIDLAKLMKKIAFQLLHFFLYQIAKLPVCLLA